MLSLDYYFCFSASIYLVFLMLSCYRFSMLVYLRKQSKMRKWNSNCCYDHDVLHDLLLTYTLSSVFAISMDSNNGQPQASNQVTAISQLEQHATPVPPELHTYKVYRPPNVTIPAPRSSLALPITSCYMELLISSSSPVERTGCARSVF
jgi:hypothetical protein